MLSAMSLDVLVEPDDRGRVSLSKIPGANVERYVGRRLADGSIILQPAVVMTRQALTSLLTIQRTADQRSVSKTKPLGEVLKRHGRGKPSSARVETVRGELAERRSNGERFLSDVTPEQRAEMIAHQSRPG